MDANFKLKQKERGFTDPPLANGFAYMVSNKKLLEHLAQCRDSKVLKDEVSPHLSIQFSLLTLHRRPSHAVQTSTLSTTPIQSSLQGMLQRVSGAWIALVTDSNGQQGWWTYKKANGMLFH